MGRRRLAMIAVGLVLVGVLVWLAVTYVEPRRAARAMRDELSVQRQVADSCRMAVTEAEARFRDYAERVDSLRERVRDYESLHPEGVPADSFDAYLRTVERFNDAVPRWETRARALEDRTDACRDEVRRHNALADSLRSLLSRIRGSGG